MTVKVGRSGVPASPEEGGFERGGRGQLSPMLLRVGEEGWKGVAGFCDLVWEIDFYSW